MITWARENTLFSSLFPPPPPSANGLDRQEARLHSYLNVVATLIVEVGMGKASLAGRLKYCVSILPFICRPAICSLSLSLLRFQAGSKKKFIKCRRASLSNCHRGKYMRWSHVLRRGRGQVLPIKINPGGPGRSHRYCYGTLQSGHPHSASRTETRYCMLHCFQRSFVFFGIQLCEIRARHDCCWA